MRYVGLVLVLVLEFGGIFRSDGNERETERGGEGK